MKALLNFLEFSPNLESLIIKKVEFSGKVPRCLEYLSSIIIQKFNGYPKELEMVKFVPKLARVLQMVILETSYTVEGFVDPRKKKINLKTKDVEALNKKVMMQLRMSPWASAGCFIKFSSS
ncbi:hypothetical protein MKX01_013256 [Papaver californicum]|nr:hypothetical protein MKX01_013256 [Papaver californicum]